MTFYSVDFIRGYITVWEVGNFLLHRPTVNSSGEHQGDENVHSKELETKKEPKVF